MVMHRQEEQEGAENTTCETVLDMEGVFRVNGETLGRIHGGALVIFF